MSSNYDRNELKKIAGDGALFDDEETLQQYASDMSFVQPQKPRYVIRPINADEVQDLVKWANSTLTPIVPVSSGAPHFRGDTVPGTKGAVIVDLCRMKKIVMVDARNRIALVEPGVTFGEIIPELEKEGLRLNMPLLPRTSKSVVSSLLEREPVIMPKYHWDGSDPLACTEVIYGTGDRFRTGSSSGSGDLDYQWKSGAAQVAAVGPAQADFHRFIQGSQGTMGIVTWVSVRCERMPQIEEPFLAGSSDLDPLLELTHWLIRLRLVDECLILNSTNLALISASKGPEGIETLRDVLPPWILFYCIAGYKYLPEERIAYQKEEIAERTQEIGLKSIKNLAEISALELSGMLRKPSKKPYWKLQGKGACEDIFFITTQDKLSELVGIMKQVGDQHGYPAREVGVYIQPVVQGTSYHCEFNLFFDPEDTQDADGVRKLSSAASEALAAAGAYFSRPYGLWAEMVYAKDAETTESLKKLKRIFDPNNIMNQGKLCF